MSGVVYRHIKYSTCLERICIAEDKKSHSFAMRLQFEAALMMISFIMILVEAIQSVVLKITIKTKIQ